ncbi:MAG TPA: diguanylate cyclase [Vicinamibacterales bacterium]|nr:diguanylate cyclase [Vicinamibacterales bacterium]
MNAKASCISDRQAARTLNAIGDAVLSTDVLGKVTYLNPVAERMTGWPRNDALGRPLAEVLRIIDATTRDAPRNPLDQAMELDTVVGLTPNCLLIARGGSETAIEDSASPIHDRRGLVIGAVIVFRDVSEARARTRQAFHLAQHDALTALPTRMLLDDRLNRAMAGARRHGHRLAVLFLDLDRFKHVNDTRGHMAGDMALQSVAHRLVACVRNTDTVSRQGGDEFVVLLPEIAQADDAAVSAKKILGAFEAPHDVAHQPLHLTATIGISLYPDDGPDAQTLVRRADTAMYCAKSSGRNTYRFFERQMDMPAV